jgi:Na+-driven multidrug efflux pump
VSALLWLVQDFVINAFKLNPQAADIVSLFCTYLAITFVFNGMLFTANATFNNLNSPRIASTLSVGKATIGTIPFVMLGSYYWQANGVLIGQAVGSVLFGVLAYWMALLKVKRMRKAYERDD